MIGLIGVRPPPGRRCAVTVLERLPEPPAPRFAGFIVRGGSRVPVLALVSLLVCAPRFASAQAVRGRVLDSATETPLSSAVIAAVEADSAILGMVLSDTAGMFVLTVPEGSNGRIRVERLGYATIESVPLQFDELEAVTLTVRMRPQPVELQGVTAVARLRRTNRNVKGFMRRQESGFGRYAGPTEIARIRPIHASQLLWLLSGRLQPGPGGRVVSRNGCNPRVYLDGNLIRDYTEGGEVGGVRIDSYISPQSVRAVEVYDNPHQAPARFQTPFMSDCPVVVIWTDYGFGLGEWSGGMEWWDDQEGG